MKKNSENPAKKSTTKAQKPSGKASTAKATTSKKVTAKPSSAKASADKTKTPRVWDMNTTYFLKTEARNPLWRVIDAQGQVVGRLATKIADALRGKDKPSYTPHNDAGDYVVVINAEKIVFTGDKLTDKEYQWYTGWIGGLKTLTAEQLLAKDPARIIEHAVKGMLPKTKLSNQLIKKLKVYAGAQHPHAAQIAK